MKKLLTFTVCAMALAAAPAFAGNHEGMKKHHGDKGAKMFEKHDIDGDGVITKEEALKNATERFEKMDADGDGSVTKEEARAAHEAMKEKWKEKREMHKEGKDTPPPAE